MERVSPSLINEELQRATPTPAQRLNVIEQAISRRVEAEYKDDIIAHMATMQQQTLPEASMMDLQPELEWHMRPYLLDFIVETHVTLRLQPQTLFLAINLIDRYCSKRVVYKKHYQLVGCTCLWIAAKYEDKKSRVPTISDLKHMCCGAYEEDMFCQMEGHVLNTLEWTVGHPTTDSYLDLFLGPESQQVTQTIRHVSRYLCEIALYPRTFFSFAPSLVASCARTLAYHILGIPCPNPNMHSSIYPSSAGGNSAEMHCLSTLAQHMQQPSRAVQKKYSRQSYCNAAQIVQSFVSQAANSNPTAIPNPATPPPTLSAPHSPASSIHTTFSEASTPSSAYFPISQQNSPANVKQHFSPQVYSMSNLSNVSVNYR
ncbi:cyclin-like protein [Yarrowia lipolytica]|uniref:Cyclin-like protein n=1 Tax=Yarrowia lipolytica TaxID=4952 RepID=A0A371C5Q6_YARLL|nr:cyclin-like protein [Yarrowia lipolytica]RDW30036.1 cyclin-like protein [Yarrowia lipolytica]RDW43289.1 cyclin-like protein [Yarrowia lipolytica]RDW52336.1 cyclin-like protein [Yarrowia lipolytica]